MIKLEKYIKELTIIIYCINEYKSRNEIIAHLKNKENKISISRLNYIIKVLTKYNLIIKKIDNNKNKYKLNSQQLK